MTTNELDWLSEQLQLRLSIEELEAVEGHRAVVPAWAEAYGDGDWVLQQQAALEHLASIRLIQRQESHDDHRADRQPDRAPPAAAAAANDKGKRAAVDCASCLEPIPTAPLRLPCAHSYCTPCLTQLFQTSIASGPFPPSCCAQPIPAALARPILPTAAFTKLQTRLTELASTTQLFCPQPRCSTLLAAHHIAGAVGTCPRCHTRVCTRCKQHSHRGACAADPEMAQLTAEKGWKLCPRCGHTVEKLEATCNKMRCVCGQNFCYQCGKGSERRYQDAAHGGCDCPIWSADDAGKVRERALIDPGWGAREEEEEEEELDEEDIRDLQRGIHVAPIVPIEWRGRPLENAVEGRLGLADPAQGHIFGVERGLARGFPGGPPLRIGDLHAQFGAPPMMPFLGGFPHPPQPRALPPPQHMIPPPPQHMIPPPPQHMMGERLMVPQHMMHLVMPPASQPNLAPLFRYGREGFRNIPRPAPPQAFDFAQYLRGAPDRA